jgi:hypothetical protein
MAAYLLSFPRFRAFNQTTGAPLAGGLLYTYAAGTSTPLATYTDQTGLTPNANPVVLNSAGEADVWLSTANYKLVLKDASGVTQWTQDTVQGVGVSSAGGNAATEWIAFTNTATYISATSFSYAGDQTTTFHVGRRLKTTNSGGTVYSTIKTSTFSAGTTTLVVVNDSGTLDSGLSAVSYGILSFANPSYLDPRSIVSITSPYGSFQTFTTNVAGKVLWSAPSVDALSEWGSSRFTAKYSGNYAIAAAVSLQPVTGSIAQFNDFCIYKNGVPYKTIRVVSLAKTASVGTFEAGAHISDPCVPLNNGDYIEFYFIAGPDTNMYIDPVTYNTWVSIVRIR